MKRICVFIFMLVFGMTTNALAKTPKSYVLKHPKHEHCHTNYKREKNIVKHRVHHHTVKTHETICIYIAPKTFDSRGSSPPQSSSATIIQSPTKTIHIHAHLDPSFIQNINQPNSVTYTFSASASVQTNTLSDLVEAPEPNLPEGILNLYSDGLLACSIEVGGNISEGECPITYRSLGAHTVVTTYTSGAVSATETETEEINPFSTTTTINVHLDECSEEEGESPHELIEGRYKWNDFSIESCTYEVKSMTIDQNGKEVHFLIVISTPTSDVNDPSMITVQKEEKTPVEEIQSNKERIVRPPIYICEVNHHPIDNYPIDENYCSGSTSVNLTATSENIPIGWTGSEESFTLAF
jgi:hypothetical protein